jgi:hypothetical protein
VNFLNAPGFALDLGQEAYAYNNYFSLARRSAIYTNGNEAIDYNYMEYTGVEAVAISGNNVLVEYNTLKQDQDEWIFGETGGQLYVAPGASTNFTFLSNYVDGKGATCPSTGCNVPYGCPGTTPCLCTAPAITGGLYNDGIEVWNGGGTFNNNELTNSLGNGLLLGNIDGSGITATTGWHSLSSTTAGQAVTLLNNDPSWTAYRIESNTGHDGVAMYFSPTYTTKFGGAFSFTDLRSQNNTPYGFEWIATTSQIKAGTTLSWGVANAACLTGNTTAAIGAMPTGFTGPSSTTTCP